MSVDLIAKKRAEYEAGEAFREMREDGAAQIAIAGLQRASEMSQRGACAGAAAFIDEYGAGIPECEWWAKESPRRSAQEWAQAANQIELEAYMSAAIGHLSESPLTKKQIKRMIAALFLRMGDDEKAAFIGWAKGKIK